MRGNTRECAVHGDNNKYLASHKPRPLEQNPVFYNHYIFVSLKVRSFGVIRIRISDPRSLGSWYIKEANKFVTRVDSSVPLMYHEPCDIGSLIRIRITPKEHTLKRGNNMITTVNSLNLSLLTVLGRLAGCFFLFWFCCCCLIETLTKQRVPSR